MYEESFLDERYTGLTAQQLKAERKKISAETETLLAALARYDELEHDAFEVDSMLSVRRMEAGKETPNDIKDVMSRAYNNRFLHDLVRSWLARVTTTDKITTIGHEDTLWGSSEYVLVPFEIDISGGITDELVADVTKVSELLNSRESFRRHDTTFRILQQELYITVDTSTGDKGEAPKHDVAVSKYSSSAFNADKGLTIREALELAYKRYPEALLRRLAGDLDYYERGGGDADKIAETKAQILAAQELRKAQVMEEKVIAKAEKVGFFAQLAIVRDFLRERHDV